MDESNGIACKWPPARSINSIISNTANTANTANTPINHQARKVNEFNERVSPSDGSIKLAFQFEGLRALRYTQHLVDALTSQERRADFLKE